MAIETSIAAQSEELPLTLSEVCVDASPCPASGPFCAPAVKPLYPRIASSQPFSANTLSIAASVFGAITALLGLSVLAGWLSHNEYLMSVLPGHIRMKPNAALCFVLTGVALTLLCTHSTRLRRVARVLSSMSMACAALTLAEYISGASFGFSGVSLDQLLFRDPVHAIHPGRMAHISAANFLLASLSLLFFRGGRRTRAVAQAAALLVTGSAFAAIVGFVYGVPILYGSVGYTSMALHTGIGFLVLGTGLLVGQPNSGLVQVLSAPESGGWVGRCLLPGVILLPVLLGWLYLRPAINFGRPRFGMALFTVTVAAIGTATLTLVALFLNRADRDRAEMIHAREQTAAAIRQSERELRLVTDHLPILLSYISPDWRYVRVNRTYEDWLGVPADQIVGKSARKLLGEIYWARTAPARQAVLRGEIAAFENIFPTQQGDRHVKVTYAPDLDEEGKLRGVACMVLDIEAGRRAEAALRHSEKLQEVNEQLQELATRDELTQLSNRRAFDERLRADFALARRHRREISLLLIDLDDFKARNDNWGHAAGDEALRKIGALLPGALRTPDLAARYGGEEFAILLPESTLQHAGVVAERIRRMVADEAWDDGQLTLSIGVASLTAQMRDPQELVAAADAALYEAKHAGKNRVFFAQD